MKRNVIKEEYNNIYEFENVYEVWRSNNIIK